MLAMRETKPELDGHHRTPFEALGIVSAVSGGSLAAGDPAMKGSSATRQCCGRA